MPLAIKIVHKFWKNVEVATVEMLQILKYSESYFDKSNADAHSINLTAFGALT